MAAETPGGLPYSPPALALNDRDRIGGVYGPPRGCSVFGKRVGKNRYSGSGTTFTLRPLPLKIHESENQERAVRATRRLEVWSEDNVIHTKKRKAVRFLSPTVLASEEQLEKQNGDSGVSQASKRHCKDNFRRKRIYVLQFREYKKYAREARLTSEGLQL